MIFTRNIQIWTQFQSYRRGS